MSKINDTASAILQFEDAASKHATAIEQGDYKTGNKCYSVVVKAVAFLKEHSELLKLSNLLNHPSVGVRLWAATYLLPIRETDGVAALKQIANGSSIHSFTAKTTLTEWEKGNLKL